MEGQLPLGSGDGGHSFRAEWAKKLVEESITKFWLSRPQEDPAWEDVKGPRPSEDEIRKGILPKIPDTGLEDKDTSPYHICIVGAGVAGLFTAMTIDRLNEKFNLGFKYDILEAADQKRFGGRLYTHRFSDQLHDYYDVGAMRFPDISIMKRYAFVFYPRKFCVLTRVPRTGHLISSRRVWISSRTRMALNQSMTIPKFHCLSL